ncbi:hypothetical protein CferDRAFT_0694 [Chlorobium ferrooxidans DSM 13031]|uniref:Lcl C-terminal domain-containing protein n=2 Tax=Chlorobium/Pelodictyon group TaxID=274493 RepID=Q0YR23_9CHLB|nr:hypothetical protein CferDRAFT_0694 [Chlorobium ferrooxidans DSM 13031]
MKSIMKFIAPKQIVRLWIVLLLSGLSMVTFSTLSNAAALGDATGGGIVFFVDKTGEHGLIAARQDLPGHSAGINYDGFFTWKDAKKGCENLELNGFSDWFLPNKEQLNQLFAARVLVGGFGGSDYWSSTENGSKAAWGQYFLSGVQYSGTKTHVDRVRAIRSF